MSCQSAIVIFTKQYLTHLISKIYSVIMFSFQNVWPIKEKLCILKYFSIIIFIPAFPSENWIGSQLLYFLYITTYLLNFSKPSSGCR